jgi:uncharacterized protein YbjT (DUF2867 family)
MILVTGAGGKTGRAVIRALKKRGADVQGIEILEKSAEKIRSLGAEAVIGDLHKLEDVTQAAEGVRAIYHISPNIDPGELEYGKIAIAAAKKAAVPRFVYHSLCHSQIEALPNHWLKLRVEEALKESGLNFTILQPTPYMQNVLGQWENVIQHGVYEIPYLPSTLLGMVDLGDIAEVAARVLTTEKTYDWATYELAGPEILSQEDVASIISRVIGKEVKLKVVNRDDWAKSARQRGMPDSSVEIIVKMFEFMESYGFWGNPGVLEWLLGRKARRFEDWITSIYKHGPDK